MKTTEKIQLAKETPPLEQPERLPHHCLIGSGVACGLEVWTDDNSALHVCRGEGVTSHGYVIKQHLPEIVFRYYTKYDNVNNYSFFKNYEVWQLLAQKHDGTTPLAPRKLSDTRAPFLKGKVVIVYLEAVVPTEDVQDQAHIQLIAGFKLVYLLIRQEDLLRILQVEAQVRWLVNANGSETDFIFSETFSAEDDTPTERELNMALKPSLLLREVPLRRFGFRSADPDDCPPDEVDIAVFPEIKSLNDIYDAYVPIIDEAVEKLEKQLLKAHELYEKYIKLHSHLNPIMLIQQLRQKWELYKSLNASSDTSLHRNYIQYFYDWLHDLIHAYHELRIELIHLVAECCANTSLYPRHLLLGLAMRDALTPTRSPLHHAFEQPPIYNNNAHRLQKIKVYFWRIMMMIKGFYLEDYIDNPNLNPYCKPKDEQDAPPPDFTRIKITPSRFYDQPLGTQAIPYYYLLSLSKYSAHRFWNYDNAQTETSDRTRSYHANDSDDSYTSQPTALRPLHYNIDNYPFFRIEGHIGKPLDGEIIIKTEKNGIIEEVKIKGVRAYLAYLQQKYNLSFDIRYEEVKASVNPFIALTKNNYSELFPKPISFTSFKEELLGMEHLAGVKEAGTFVVIYEKNKEGKNVVIADFSLPYRCCESVVVASNPANLPMPKSALEVSEKEQPVSYDDRAVPNPLLQKIGTAKPEEKDDLTTIRGIGKKLEQQLNALGIYTFQQLSRLEDADYGLLDDLLPNVFGHQKIAKWVEQAKNLL